MAADENGITSTVIRPSGQFSADNYTVEQGKPSVEVAAADPRRRTVTVINDPDSTGVVFVMPGKGQLTGGFRLVPGAGFEFTTAAAVNARAVGGSAVVNVVTESGWGCS